MRTELVDLVDADDRDTGTATLEQCLRDGLLHRAVAVLVFRKDGRLVLQQRALNDLWHPGRWTLSCTGHVKAGESYAAAARRELAEELGLRAILRPLAKFRVPKVRSRGLVELEIVCVFTCRTDLLMRIDKKELERAIPVSESALRLMLKGRALTPDAKFLLKKSLDLVRHELGAGVPSSKFASKP